MTRVKDKNIIIPIFVSDSQFNYLFTLKNARLVIVVIVELSEILLVRLGQARQPLHWTFSTRWTVTNIRYLLTHSLTHLLTCVLYIGVASWREWDKQDRYYSQFSPRHGPWQISAAGNQLFQPDQLDGRAAQPGGERGETHQRRLRTSARPATGYCIMHHTSPNQCCHFTLWHNTAQHGTLLPMTGRLLLRLYTQMSDTHRLLYDDVSLWNCSEKW